MVDSAVSEIDWDNLIDNIPDDLNFDFLDDPSNGSSPDSICLQSVEDVEQYLFNEDDDFNLHDVLTDEFFSDVILDSSPGSGSDPGKDSSASPESVKGDDEKEPQENGAVVIQTKEDNVVVVDDDDDDNDNDNSGSDNDPAAKKRKRQMRNRDAAVRSRERKKSYVKDLEMKSKYYEAECKRLGILFQCCIAENQALRLSLHNTKAFDASMTKQESAVLVMESLLLGSLLWFLGIICLQILPILLLSNLEVGLLENVDSVKIGRAAQRKAGTEVFRVPILQSYMMGKRCKASRSRMKLIFV